jgi:hypothetical protein
VLVRISQREHQLGTENNSKSLKLARIERKGAKLEGESGNGTAIIK